MSNRLLGSGLMKTKSKIKSFEDVKKALQDLEKAVNEISESLNKESETEVADADGKTGDTQATRNADGTYNFEIKTIDGWKTPVIGKTAIKFTDKPASISKPYLKNISDIETEDTSTGASDAEKTIFDEKDGKFKVNHLTGIPRPDYDSGWVEGASADQAITVEHNLDVTNFSLIDFQISNSSTGANATWLSITDADEGGYIIQVKDSNNIFVGTDDAGPPRFDCAGLTWQDEYSTHFRLRLWK